MKRTVAIVYDRVNKWGGAERVIIALRKIFPESDLFTSVYEKNRASWANKINVIPSFLQKIPLASRYHEAFALFMPIAFESFNFDKYDLVISVTSESGKGIITKPKTRHISVILTPTRYLWSGYKNYFPNELFRILAWPAVSYLRFWDKIAAKRPDQLIAISRTVQNRVKKFIIYGPKRYKDNVFDLLLMTLKYKGQEMDIYGINSEKLFNKKTNKWNKARINLSKTTKKKVFNLIVSIIPLKDLISYKKKISRNVDIQDIKALSM